MRIYFLSSQPCALRLGGVFFGLTDRFERYAEINLADNIFVEFLPENALPITFFLNENIRFLPPEHCEVYLLKDGIAIFAAEFTPTDFSLKTLWQRRFGDTLLTIFSQGRLQLGVQTPQNVFSAYLPPTLFDFDGQLHNGYVLISGKTHRGNHLLVFRETGEKVLDEEVLSFSLSGDILRAELPLAEHLGRTALCTWSLKKEDFERTEFILRTATKDENPHAIPEDLIAYAFFESVLIGANYTEFLCEELVQNADKIVDFLGDFLSVILTDDPLNCGLVRKKAERLFSVSYYRVKLQNGKIIDING